VISGVSPNLGGTGGGTNVTITGTGFCNNTTAVDFGATPAASWVLVDDLHITAVSPAHAVGTVDVTVTNNAATSVITAADHFTFLPDSPSVYTAQTPVRLLDTRNNGGRLGPGGDYVLRIGGISVPANANAVILNVTVTNTSSGGALIVYPTGAAQPTASNLNWTRGETVPNLVSVGLGTSGQITIHNIQGAVDVVVDLEGYFAPSGGGTAGEFVALTPARITDTRSGSGQPNAGSKLGAGSTLNVQVTGAGGVPVSGAAAVVLNVTVTNTSAAGALIVWPTGQARPLASNLNWSKGKTVPNRAVVALGTAGQVSIYNISGSTDVIVDVNGYFTDSTASGAVHFSLTPARILDTRIGTGGISSPIGPNGTMVVTVAGRGSVPLMSNVDAPKAVVLNVTVTNTTAASALIVWPDLAGRPVASDLNWTAGMTVPNLVIVKVGANGNIDLYNIAGSAAVVIDVEGYFS
jgi:hypothetical protein